MAMNKLPDARDLDLLRTRMSTQFQIPSAYDDALSYQGLVYKLIQYLKDTMQNVEDWNIWLEDFVATFDTRFHDTVRVKIKELYNSGEFAELVAQVIDDVQDEIYGVDSKIDAVDERLTTQLTQKASKAELLQTNTVLSGVDQRIDNLVIPVSPENANVEVTDAHVSTVKGKTFDSLSKRFGESEKEIGYLERFNGVIENVVKHDEWSAIGGTLSSEAGLLTLSGSGNTSNVYIRQPVGKTNHKYYFKASVRPLSERTNGIELLYGSNRISVRWGMTVGEWYVIEGVYDIDELNNLTVKHLPVGSGAILPAEQIQVKEVMGLDLTYIFGSGNEPVLEGVKSFINDLGIVHFDGKVSQYNLKEIAEHTQDVPRLTKSVDFFLDNKINNGDFKRVTQGGNFYGWTITSGSTTNTWESTSQGAKITLNSEKDPLNLIQAGEVLEGHVYYVSGEIKSTTPYSEPSDKFIYLPSTYGQMPLGDVTREFVRKSGLRIPTSSANTYIMSLSAGVNQPVGSSVYFNNIMVIDLTDIFGAGNEPSLEEMDSLYEIIDWFEGTKTVSQSVMIKWLRIINQINGMQEHNTSIPEYVENDIQFMNRKLAYEHGKDFKFAFMTDIHDKEEHYKYIARLMEYGYVEGLVVNGDLGKSSNESSRERTMDYFIEHSKNLKNIRQNVCFTRGNHDGVVDHSFTDEDFTNSVIRPFVKENLENKGYYYVDYANESIRMIFLNSAMDSLSRLGFSLDQVDWFRNVLNSTPDNWSVITVSHHHLLEAQGTPIPTNADLIVNAIQDFKTAKPLCNHIGHFFGHLHEDIVETLEGVNYVCVNSSNHYPQVDRFTGTNSEYVIDFICINKSTRTVDLLRMGHGEDRSYTY